MKRHLTGLFSSLLVGIVLLMVPSWSRADEPHVVVVAGTTHYSPDVSMPVFAKELQRLGFKTTLVMGEGDPEKKTENVLPGLEALSSADAAIFYLRFMQLPDDEWKIIEEYLKSGKPVIGLRTTSHSFLYPKDHPRSHWNDGFGRRVIGTPYIAHQSGTTELSKVKSNETHPIMTNVGDLDWQSSGKLYLTRLEKGCIPLVLGTGSGRPRIVHRDFGPTAINETETDFAAWVWENEWGGKVFGTSFGHLGDFQHESFTRMLVNSVSWALDQPVLSPDTKINTWKFEIPPKKKK